jgi:DNA-binding NtrC family response regulator
MTARRAKPSLLVADHDAAHRRHLLAGLRGEFSVFEAGTYEDTYKVLEDEQPDVLLFEIELAPGELRDALRLIREVDRSALDTLIIAMCAEPEKGVALKVMEAGAYDFLRKPVALDVLGIVLERAVEKQRIERENRILREEFYRQQSFGDLVGNSATIREVYDAIRKIADSNASVIIRGESGTGKELVAQAIHQRSRRAEKPFVSINCAALPETLMEAELFGYEKGAFTGAASTKEGRFELAHEGTLFLDEIGTLSLALQTKLLRVLEERAFVRLGGKKAVEVDIRLVTATNEDLEAKVGAGQFRDDLYYRINVVPIQIPPLRERAEDIPLLLNYFLQVYSAANNIEVKQIEESAMLALERYSWPGNVRELQNLVQRMVLLTEGNEIRLRDLPPVVLKVPAADSARSPLILGQGIDLDRELAGYERQWLEIALTQAEGVKAQAARLLGVNKDRMKYLCRKHGL